VCGTFSTTQGTAGTTGPLLLLLLLFGLWVIAGRLEDDKIENHEISHTRFFRVNSKQLTTI
jgi:hypothetical protein